MIEPLELEDAVTGVVCLHCGLNTPVPSSARRGVSAQGAKKLRPPITLIRCTECGREAPYLANEIVILKNISNVFSFAA
jgi:hypothetical protein